jgi:diguanylate cyclase (GGDEF)-like protein
MIDVNDFKSTNDRLGHEAGDTILKAVAEVLVDELRTIDIVIRYGGDEFLLILPETGKSIYDVTRRIRANAPKALQHVVPFMDSPVTLAIGASFWDCTRGIPIEDALAEADRRMYEDKGRRPS